MPVEIEEIRRITSSVLSKDEIRDIASIVSKGMSNFRLFAVSGRHKIEGSEIEAFLSECESKGFASLDYLSIEGYEGARKWQATHYIKIEFEDDNASIRLETSKSPGVIDAMARQIEAIVKSRKNINWIFHRSWFPPLVTLGTIAVIAGVAVPIGMWWAGFAESPKVVSNTLIPLSILVYLVVSFWLIFKAPERFRYTNLRLKPTSKKLLSAQGILDSLVANLIWFILLLLAGIVGGFIAHIFW